MTISRTPVDRTLTANPGTWQLGVIFTYQCLCADTAIAPSTAETFKVPPVNSKTKISVKVTVTKSGYTTVVKTSATVTISSLA